MKQILRSLFLLLLAVVWGGEVLAQEVTLDFTSNSVWKFPTSGTAASASGTYSNGTYSVTVSDKVYYSSQGKYLMVTGGKTVTLPTFNFEVEKIVVSTTSGMSKTATSNILVGGKVASTEIKGVGPLTFAISKDYQALGNVYTFKSTTSGKNVQVTKIEVYKKASDKTATSLTFPQDEINIEEGNEASFAAQTATLKAGEETLIGKTITYATTGADIFATFETTTGAATLKTGSYGKATITASFAGDDTYAASSKSYIVNYTEKQKTATTLAFVDAPTEVKNIGDEFQLHTSLTADDATIDGDVTYDSSDKTVATIDADGNVKALAKGTTTITATFAGNDTYAKSEASFRLTVIDPNVIEPVTFDFSNPESFGFAKSEIETSGNEIKIEEGSSIASGIVTLTNKEKGSSTGSRFYNASGTIAYRAYKGDINTVSVPKGYVITEISIETKKAKERSFKIGENEDNSDWTGSAQSVDINYNGSSVLYSMTVTYEKLNASTITLSETDADVATTIVDNDGKTVNVKLQRTLKAGIWNTICLPFAVDADDVKNVLKAEGNVKEYESEDEATATINFKDATTLEAGVPYLIKPTEAATELYFEFVTIKNVDVDNLETVKGNQYCFCGVFAPTDLSTTGTDLFLGSNGKFFVPAVGKNKMNGFRAYFNVPNGTSAANMNINFGDATGINGVTADVVKSTKVYNLNGQYVGTSLNALPRGIYVVNGKKVMK